MELPKGLALMNAKDLITMIEVCFLSPPVIPPSLYL